MARIRWVNEGEATDERWTDPQIAECVYVTALFAFFNRVADAFGIDGPRDLANPGEAP